MESSSMLNLPDEKIYEICQKLDNKSLGNFVQSSSKAYNICQEILNERNRIIEEKVSQAYNSFINGEYYMQEWENFDENLSASLSGIDRNIKYVHAVEINVMKFNDPILDSLIDEGSKNILINDVPFGEIPKIYRYLIVNGFVRYSAY